jgi:L-methionine (R)-S-oxide reductase
MSGPTKLARYARIADQIEQLIENVQDPVARRATAVAILFHKLPGVSWVGFYLLKNEHLVVDVYQGPVACLVLDPPNGVCWTALDSMEPLIVDDVQEAESHVACDPRTRSEIVLPHFNQCGDVIGALDLDSHHLGHFDADDREGLGKVLLLLEDPC